MANDKGEAIYFNGVEKNGRFVWVLQGIGDTVIIGRDKQRLKSRTFTNEAQAWAYVKRHGFLHVWCFFQQEKRQ